MTAMLIADISLGALSLFPVAESPRLQTRGNLSGGAFVTVPFWRTFLDFLFPKEYPASRKTKMELNEEDDGAKDSVVSAGQPSMTTTSVHRFGDDGDHSFSITVIENLKEEYGLFVWPCSIILAEYVWQQRSRFSEANVVELGAGTSLPGLVAAKVGANVTLTDDSSRPEVLSNMRRVCELNNVNCKVVGLTWGVWDAPIFTLCPDIILGADVLYETSAFDDLFAVVALLLKQRPSSVFITAYHNRSGHHLIEFLMVKWELKCVKLLDGFSFVPAEKASGLSGNLQLVEIILDRRANGELV